MEEFCLFVLLTSKSSHRHGGPVRRERPPSLNGLGTIALDGAEQLDGAVEGIGICPHGDLGGDGTLLVEAQGGAEVVHGRVLIVVGLLGIGGGKEGIDVERIIREKHEYNKMRPYRHGGKKC